MGNHVSHVSSIVAGHVAFKSEADMVERFVKVLRRSRSTFGMLEVVQEWDHRAGLVDVLARNRSRSLIAFEAKLYDWKRAFHQAYKNTAYADCAYVLLPKSVVHRAILNREEFEDRGIGLCSFDGRKVEVQIRSRTHEPLLGWIRHRAHGYITDCADELSRKSRSCG
jgi:hypothetical protein